MTTTGIYPYIAGGSNCTPDDYYGKRITAAELHAGEDVKGRLYLTFDDGVKIAIWDRGQVCCEERYMTTDDDPASLVGHVLTRIEVKEGPSSIEDEYGYIHEQKFLEIGTDQSFMTIVTHNEHNGYYGGFWLTITEEQPPAAKRIL